MTAVEHNIAAAVVKIVLFINLLPVILLFS